MGDEYYCEMNRALEDKTYIGNIGGCNTSYYAITELQVDKRNKHKHGNNFLFTDHLAGNKDKHMPIGIKKLINDPRIIQEWKGICTINPDGLNSHIPSMSATTARMSIPELKLEPDGEIVNEDFSINITKIGIEQIWHIGGIAKRLMLDEKLLRKKLYDYCNDEKILNQKNNIYIPPIGGHTIYIIGNVEKLKDPNVNISLRSHDECNGSDVFGTDICTCRPYLIYAIQCAVECAKAGGIGIIIYSRKEGRALGEIIKYRVYNQRKNQEGGDTSEKYFENTCQVAGVEDARIQEFIPDVIKFLGITRIKWLVSMSNMKYDSMKNAGIEIEQRISIPQEYVHDNALVEISAKIKSGYNDFNNITQDPEILYSLQNIYENSEKIFMKIINGNSKYFIFNKNNYELLESKIEKELNENYKKNKKFINHSRLNHFEYNKKDYFKILHDENWKTDKIEKLRRSTELIIISCLLDAGAGDNWKYYSIKTNEFHKRSEGLGLCTLQMYEDGLFSSDPANPYMVNAYGLKNLSLQKFMNYFQINDNNDLIGITNRYSIIKKLSLILESNTDYYGYESPRLGNIVDFINLNYNITESGIKDHLIYDILVKSLKHIWENENSFVKLPGDIWIHPDFKDPSNMYADHFFFNKILQWINFSVIDYYEKFTNIEIIQTDILLPLSEYRNGGLLIDENIISLKNSLNPKCDCDCCIPTQNNTLDKKLKANSPIIIEWRAITINLLKKLFIKIKPIFKNLTISQFLENGSWIAGRKIAYKKRDSGNPPLNILLDGVYF
jgi:GTP cyclohydrolase II